MKPSLYLGALVAIALASRTPDVEACGGCFAPPETQQVVTDHRMVMAIHPTESILWDQIRYTGAPAEFSWVLPVFGDVRIEVGSEDFFSRLEQSTQVQVLAPPNPSACATGLGFNGSLGAVSESDRSSDAGVTVINQAVVGPYQTVTLRSEDSGALRNWLSANHYSVPPSVAPVIDWYTARHMDFVALKLRPGVGVQAMQPIRIRYASPSMVLPLRMVAAGVGDKVGITLWVFGTGRYEAANFANGEILETDLTWDWTNNRSDYPAVFAARLGALAGGRSWITQFAGPAADFGYQFSNTGSVPWYDAGEPDGGDAGAPEPTAADDWTLATHQNAPDLWISRLRTDLLARFLDADLVLTAAASDARVSNRLQVTRARGTPPNPCAGRTGSPGATSAGGGCSATPVGTNTGAMGLGAFCLVGLAGLLTRRRGAKQQG